MSNRTERITFRLDEAERRVLSQLTKEMKRTQSDVIRWVLREAGAALLTVLQEEDTGDKNNGDQRGFEPNGC